MVLVVYTYWMRSRHVLSTAAPGLCLWDHGLDPAPTATCACVGLVLVQRIRHSGHERTNSSYTCSGCPAAGVVRMAALPSPRRHTCALGRLVGGLCVRRSTALDVGHW